MVQAAGSETERKITAILKVLTEFPEPLGSITIARRLEREGGEISPEDNRRTWLHRAGWP